MKRTVISAALLCLFAGAPFYSFAADPFKVAFCMYGKATGNSGGSKCKSAERDFFNIVKKNKHGFQPGRTFDARKAFLGECPDAGKEAINTILSKYGRKRGG